MRYPVPSVVSVVLTRLRLASQEEVSKAVAPPKWRIGNLDKPIKLKNPPLRRSAGSLERASNM